MPVFTAAALNSDPDGLALLHAVLKGPEQAESARARPSPIWGCATDLTADRPAGRRGLAKASRVQAAVHPVCLA